MAVGSTTAARVLLVDDDPVILETLHAVLEHEFTLDTAESVRSGLKKLRENSHYDVVITDYDLGDGTGEAILRWAASTRDPPAGILLTGHPDYQDVRRLQREVEFLVLFKPVDPDALISWVRHEATIARLRRSVSRSGRIARPPEE